MILKLLSSDKVTNRQPRRPSTLASPGPSWLSTLLFTSVNPLGPGDSLQLATKFVPGTTYEWYRDEQRLEGASDFRLTIPISRRGRYQVVLQQPPNCSWRTNVVNFNPADFLGPLATPDDELAQQIRVWPNPFAERVVIELVAGLAPETVRLALTDALGRPVAHGRATLPSGAIALQLGQLPKGVYLLRITHRDRAMVQKLVRE
jgi:Secretion system C-terminal sorting domain